MAFFPASTLAGHSHITVLVSDHIHLGHIAYASTTAYLLRYHFPEKEIRVIIEVDEAITETKGYDHTRLFLFPENSQILWLTKTEGVTPIPSASPLLQQNQVQTAQSWLDKSDFVIIASYFNHSHLTLNNASCLFISQIDNHEYHGDALTEYTRLTQNFISLQEPLSLSKEEYDDLQYSFWIPRAGQLFWSDMRQWLPGNNSLNKITTTINQLLNSSEQPARRQIQPLCNCKYLVNIGLDRDEHGILVNPFTLKKARFKHNAFKTDYQNALKKNPTLANTLIPSKDLHGNEHYYIAYKHTALDYAEFVATVILIERQTPEIWFISNLSEKQLDTTIFKGFLEHYGINRIVFHSSTKHDPKEKTLSLSGDGKTVHLVQLPPLSSNEYTAMFAQAQQPVGVTSNNSLFLAATLHKLPVYTPNSPLQSGVNNLLYLFDNSGTLRPLFSNKISPTSKAEAISHALEHPKIITDWANTLLRKKTANSAIIAAVNNDEVSPSSTNPSFIGGACNEPNDTIPPEAPPLLNFNLTGKRVAVGISAILTPLAILAIYKHQRVSRNHHYTMTRTHQL